MDNILGNREAVNPKHTLESSSLVESYNSNNKKNKKSRNKREPGIFNIMDISCDSSECKLHVQMHLIP